MFLAAAALIVFCTGLLGAGSESEPAGEKIVRVVVKGNVRVNTHKILAQMRLREGSAYTPAAVDEDLKRIYALGDFDNVILRPEKAPEGLLLVVEVTERPTLERLVFEGNRHFKDKELAEAIGATAGALLDRHKIFAGARTIERKYHDAGYHFAAVTLDEELLKKSQVAKFAVSEGPRVRVRKILFTGNASIPGSELEKQIETKTYFPIFAAGVFDEEQLARDVTALRNYYVEQGFLDVKVGRELEFSPDKTRLTIRFIVEEGPRYRVRSVALEGIKRFAPSYLEKQMELAPGKPYTAEIVRHDIEKVRENYGEVGYIDVFIRPVVDFTSVAGEVDVALRVEEHTPVKVGEIRVEGNRLTQDKVIRRELRLFPEEWVNTKLLDRAKTRLEGLGLFKPGSVQITTIPTAREGIDDVLVRVEETETTNLILGAGISSNSGILGNISLVNRNFDFADWPKSWQQFWRGESFRGAGQTFQIVLEPGTELQRYRIDFREPHLMDTDVSFSSSLFYFERGRDTYDEQRVGLNFGFGKEIRENVQAFVNFRLEDVNISKIEAGVPKDVTDVKGSNPLASVEVGLVKDTTDSFLFPTEGYRLMGSVEQGATSSTFTKITLDARKYWTVTRDVLDRKSVLAVHGRLGWIPGDAPIFERFYAGGQGSIRGFRFRGVGPRKGDTELGGDFLALASAEYSFPIFEKNLSGVFFLDTGTVEKDITISSWRAAVGFGIRFTIPFFGPVPFDLDFGIPVMKNKDDRTEIFSFSIGTSF